MRAVWCPEIQNFMIGWNLRVQNPTVRKISTLLGGFQFSQTQRKSPSRNTSAAIATHAALATVAVEIHHLKVVAILVLQ